MITEYSINILFLFNITLFFLALLSFKIKRGTLFISFIQTFLIAIFLGVRGPNVGADTTAYILEYNRGKGGYFSEILFKLIGRILYSLEVSYTGYFLFISLLTFLIIFYANLRFFTGEKIYYIPLVNWLMFSNSTVILNAVNGIRQGLAMAFIYLAFTFLKEKSFKANLSYLLLILAASEIHESAIIFLPLMIPKVSGILANIKLKGFLLFSFSLGILYKVIFKSLSIFDDFSNKMMNYSGGEFSSMFFIKIFIAILFFILISKIIKPHILKGAYVYILFWIIITVSSPLASNRFFYYLGYLYSPLIVMSIIAFQKTKGFNIFLVSMLNIVYYIMIIHYSSMIKTFSQFY